MRRVLIFLFLAIPAVAQSRIDCDALTSRVLGQLVHYCVLLPPGYDSPAEKSVHYPVLYFLHGLGDNEQTLVKSGGWNLVEDLRQQGKIGDFLIVTPEGKGSFYVNSADGKVRYSDFFRREFMPYIENKFRVERKRRARAISGISMGGYGALHFAFAYPELFSAVSAESAALMTASPQELDSAMRPGTPLGRVMGPVFGNPINAFHWKENSPFVLAKENRIAISSLAIYFNCGHDDDFQFEVGAEALHRELESEGIRHEYHLYPGDHSSSYFLSHLGEVMQFHSRHFEKKR
jgi:S-formylglutathione hydrolase FrmB